VRREAIEEFVRPVEAKSGESDTADDYGKPFSFDNPLWDIVGIIKDGPSDLAENHDKYLAEAYADLHEE
jgi:hypothetical protein